MNTGLHRVFRLTPDSIDGKKPLPLKFVGGWLLTSPEEDLSEQVEDLSPHIESDPASTSQGTLTGIQVNTHTHHTHTHIHHHTPLTHTHHTTPHAHTPSHTHTHTPHTTPHHTTPHTHTRTAEHQTGSLECYTQSHGYQFIWQRGLKPHDNPCRHGNLHIGNQWKWIVRPP